MVSFNGSDRNTLLETNIKGTENICKICLERGVRLCFVSSIAALGDAPNESVVIDENTPEISGSVHSLYSGLGVCPPRIGCCDREPGYYFGGGVTGTK